ncbi:hypothetical protein [Corynebacterium flavescens]|uniref:Uncharacterized protein n=1 Tax=Corynebacterium flavescens TaxID=28028 RepID=A0A1L7CMA0_CORFL|nr:hypothetical protein [Corynebacterium flavescens]APT86987.1 hypothetical protein CFLV_07170 [Corynebacterium flavescens]KAA8721814.1 hypothetical protein F4V60_07010 [Corynebacterium flavescens]GEB96816.1 hypothetical protein CFL01nite_03110 [Corynebacterium flavescens]
MAYDENPFLDPAEDADSSDDSKSSREVDVKEEEEEPTFTLKDAQWLRAQRGLVVRPAELSLFQEKMAAGVDGFKNSRGFGIGTAIVVTILAILIAIAGVALGYFIMNAAGDWISSMRES